VTRWIVLAVALGIAMTVGLMTALNREDPGVLTTATGTRLTGTRSIELLFPGSGGGLARETREIIGSDHLETDVLRTIEELIAGPESGDHPLPATTRVLSVFYDSEGEVTVNFSDDLPLDHPGGSDAEIETIRSLVTTIGVNFAGVDRVRVLVEGDAVETLAGHVDLSRPLRVEDYQ
jgi:hypothetical protein